MISREHNLASHRYASLSSSQVFYLYNAPAYFDTYLNAVKKYKVAHTLVYGVDSRRKLSGRSSYYKKGFVVSNFRESFLGTFFFSRSQPFFTFL